MTKKIQILMPMGGLGQRFRDEGYQTPKPLIPVNGKQMFIRALESFNNVDIEKEYIFVVRQDAEDQYGLATSIKELIPKSKIAILKQNTNGAAETVLVARDLINDNDPLIVMDCDFSFKSRQYFEYVTQMMESNIYEGILLSFHSDNPRYSYAKVDENDTVLETAEKLVISNNALAGAYCFSHGDVFKKYADKLIEGGLTPKRKEYYISYVFLEMLKDGLRVKLANIDEFNSFGTPLELQDYLEKNDD